MPRTPTSAPSRRSCEPDYGKLQVVYAHDLQALRVDDLTVHEVACKQHLVGLQIAEADVVRFDLQGDAVVVECVDVLAPRDHERNLARAPGRPGW